LVPGDELEGHEQAAEKPGEQSATGSTPPASKRNDLNSGTRQPGSGLWPARGAISSGLIRARKWLAIFAASLALFLLRFLVPTPVAQADNRDGPRLLCGLGLGPVTGGHPLFFRYAYFEYVSRASCAGRVPYPSSELVALEIGRVLTPVFGLPGELNMIAVGVLWCALASVGIASLVTGLRVPLYAQLLMAAAIWVIMADASFFDTNAGPFSEPAALVGLLLVAAGVVYLGRGWRSTVIGLTLAGTGGFLAILSKEQYLILAAPICVTLALAGAAPGRWYSPRRFRTREAAASLLIAVFLAVLAAGYTGWDFTSNYGKRLHYIQAVDMIFTDIVTQRSTAPAQLRALGLPVSWAKYAGRYYWDVGSVRISPDFSRYEGQLNAGTIARYLVTHPGSIISVGQAAAEQAQVQRVYALGDYPASAGYPPGKTESRVIAFSWLMQRLPADLGLLWYVPLWCVMAAIAIAALARRRRPWHRDGAVLVLCMIGCAIAAFIPPAYFAGISTTRHMVGMNLATALALTIAAALAVSMIYQAIKRPGRPPTAHPAAGVPELASRGS
jgi:hypothetical protein